MSDSGYDEPILEDAWTIWHTHHQQHHRWDHVGGVHIPFINHHDEDYGVNNVIEQTRLRCPNFNFEPYARAYLLDSCSNDYIQMRVGYIEAKDALYAGTPHFWRKKRTCLCVALKTFLELCPQSAYQISFSVVSDTDVTMYELVNADRSRIHIPTIISALSFGDNAIDSGSCLLYYAWLN